jgi:hypothetical protein
MMWTWVFTVLKFSYPYPDISVRPSKIHIRGYPIMGGEWEWGKETNKG